MKKELVFAIIMFFANPTFSEEKQISLKEAISIALINNQFLKENQKSLEIAKLNLISVHKEYKPKIGLESKVEKQEMTDFFTTSSSKKYTNSLGYNWQLLTFTSGLFTFLSENSINRLYDKDPLTPLFSSNPKIAITWKQALSKGGRLSERLILTEKEEDYELGKISYDENKKKLILNVIISYFNLLKALKKREYAERQISLTKKLLTLSEIKLKAGEISELDVMNIKVRLARDEMIFMETKEEEDDKRKEFLKILGLGEDIKLLPLETEISEEKKGSYLIEDVLKSSNELQAFNIKLEKAKREILIAKSINKPILTLEGNYTWIGEGGTLKESLKEFPTKSWVIGCKISWPFFDSGVCANKVEKASLNYEILNERLKELKDDLKEEFLMIENDLQKEARRIDFLSLSLKNAKEVLRITQLKYEMGMVSLKELLEAQITTFELDNFIIESKINYAINKAKLSWLCGKIEEEYVK